MSARIENDPQFPGTTYAIGWYCQDCGFDYDTLVPEHTEQWEPSHTYPRCPGCGHDTVESAAWSEWDLTTGDTLT